MAKIEDYNPTILPEILQQFDYYKSKLPMYLQNDEAFQSHFKLWFQFLIGNATTNGVINVSSTVLKLLDIFADDYLSVFHQLPNADEEKPMQIFMLDYLGSLFNVLRTSAKTNEGILQYPELTDEELLLLIKAQIVQNYSDGTYIQAKEFYDKVGLALQIVSSGNASIQYQLLRPYDFSDNIKTLFKLGLLTIKSMGIGQSYYYETGTELVWDEQDSTYGQWDTGVWGL